MGLRLVVGDCRGVMAEMDAESIDAIVTDPPYGINFMGRDWDTFSPGAIRRREAQLARKGPYRVSEAWPEKRGNPRERGGGAPLSYDESVAGNGRYQAWCCEWASECLRVLKPGGHLLAFGGPRTFHRLTAGVEDAGFEIRDTLLWLYGSGYPKSRNLGDGLGTALKPAFEPIVLARKALIGTVAENVAAWGTGALNIDDCRIPHRNAAERAESEGKNQHAGYANPGSNHNSWSGAFPPRTDYDGGQGRWPANVLLDAGAAAMVDASVAPTRSRRGAPRRGQPGNGWGITHTGAEYDDAGGPSRFWYVAKPSAAERNAGLEGLPEHTPHPEEPNGRAWDIPGSRATARANSHPTVKPASLMRWIVRLVTPAGGLVLDPFMGSGTTGVACVLEERAFLGIEQEAAYVEIARRRIAHAQGPLFADVAVAD